MVGEPDPVAEQGALREWTRRVDRDHADCAPLFADVSDERRDETRLADSGWAGDADCIRAAGLGIDVADEVVGERVTVLDE